MTQMTLMTLNLGYGIGISPKQRRKRHQRHYRHARTVPGVWGTPLEMCMWMTTCYASKTRSRSKRGGVIKADAHTNSYMLQSESV